MAGIIIIVILVGIIYLWLKSRSKEINQKQQNFQEVQQELNNPKYSSIILNDKQDNFIALDGDDIYTSYVKDPNKVVSPFPARTQVIGLNNSTIIFYQLGLSFIASNQSDAINFYNELAKHGAKEIARITPPIKIDPNTANELNIDPSLYKFTRFFHIKTNEPESINDPVYNIGNQFIPRLITDIEVKRNYQVDGKNQTKINYVDYLLTIQDEENRLHRIEISTDRATYNIIAKYFLASNSFINNSSQNTSDNIKHQLENLKELLNQGILTEDEFEAKKKAILNL